MGVAIVTAARKLGCSCTRCYAKGSITRSSSAKVETRDLPVGEHSPLQVRD